MKLDYKLYAVGEPSAPAAAGNSKASSGGIGVGTVLKVAAFAGRMYLNTFGMGMMNPLLSMPGLGGVAGPFAASGLFDPRMTAVSSMTQIMGVGGAGGAGSTASESEAALEQTVGEALGGAAKNTMEQLQSRKK